MISFERMARFKKGETGNPKGRATAKREAFKFDFLDTKAIPEAIRHLYAVVMGTHPDVRDSKGIDKVRVQNEAAKALLAKAPDRSQITGGDGKELKGVILVPSSSDPPKIE